MDYAWSGEMPKTSCFLHQILKSLSVLPAVSATRQMTGRPAHVIYRQISRTTCGRPVNSIKDNSAIFNGQGWFFSFVWFKNERGHTRQINEINQLNKPNKPEPYCAKGGVCRARKVKIPRQDSPA